MMFKSITLFVFSLVFYAPICAQTTLDKSETMVPQIPDNRNETPLNDTQNHNEQASQPPASHADNKSQKQVEPRASISLRGNDGSADLDLDEFFEKGREQIGQGSHCEPPPKPVA